MQICAEMRWLGISLLLLPFVVNAFCPPGCTCSNETRNVLCDNVPIDSIPIFLNPSLKTLVLKNSQVRLDTDSIRLYKDLEYLDLSNNSIQEFPAEFFDQLTSLRQLRLTANRIAKISTELFLNLETLEHLDLSDNRISQLESNAFDGLTQLTFLNLSGNQIRFVEPNFTALTKLKTLDVSRNDVRTIASGSLQPLVNLEHLDLSDNSVGHLHPQMFDRQNKLMRLDLQGNRLEEVQRNVFDGLFSLESLNLSRNMLKTIEVSNWRGVKQLDTLDLSHNPLFSLDHSPFRGLSSVRLLHLNSIDYLSEIQNNSFNGLYKLEKLSISGCAQMSRIHPAAFVENLALKHVDLSANGLKMLHSETFRWELLEYLNLGGNPWNCNCSLLSFLPSVLRRIKRTGRAVCVEPSALAGVELVNARSPKCSTAPNSTLILVGAAVFLALLITLVLFALCVRSAVCRFWKRNRKLVNNKNGRAPLYAPSSSFSDSLIYDKQHDPSTAVVVTCEPSGRSITSSNSLNYPYFRPPFCYQHPDPNADYYSSIGLPPPQLEVCHQCGSTGGYATCTIGMSDPTNHQNKYPHYAVEVSPYAVGQSRLIRPPSFVAPPPPPSMPPPKLAYRHVNT